MLQLRLSERRGVEGLRSLPGAPAPCKTLTTSLKLQNHGLMFFCLGFTLSLNLGPC